VNSRNAVNALDKLSIYMQTLNDVTMAARVTDADGAEVGHFAILHRVLDMEMGWGAEP